MEEINHRVEILSRDIDLIEMNLWEIELRNKKIDLDKKLVVISRLDKAKEAIAETLNILGWGSVEEIK